MYRIANLVMNGIMPEGYEIKWWFKEAPGKVFDDVVASEYIELSRDEVPMPERIHVIGENVVDIDRYMSFMEEDNELVDFGEVYLWTRFRLKELKFFYPAADGAKLRSWWERTYGQMIETGVKKRDVVFDVTYKRGDVVRHLYNTFMNELSFPEEKDGIIEVRLICDFVYSDF